MKTLKDLKKETLKPMHGMTKMQNQGYNEALEDVETLIQDKIDEHAKCRNSEEGGCEIHRPDNLHMEECDGTKWDTCTDYSAREPELYKELKSLLGSEGKEEANK